jgi:hypothetical protein
MANIPLNIDSLVGAALAPVLGVIAFWFLQLIFIEIQKRILTKFRHPHEAFCRFTNFIGILFQTICHALGYTVTRSGIATFHVTVNYGTVEPKKEKTGVFEWIATSFLLLGPFFIPAGLALLFSVVVIGNAFVFPAPSYSFVESLTNFGIIISAFIQRFFNFLIHIDLFNPLHVGFLFVLLFFGLGIRPSYVGEERKAKIDMIHDLKNIFYHLRKKPLYILVIILGLYAFYFLSLFLNQNWYMALFSVFGWISLTAIIALFLTYLLLFLIRSTDHIRGWWKAVSYLTVPVSYVIARIIFLYYPVRQGDSISLLLMLVCTCIVTILLIKYKKTNRFKTATKMKHARVADGKKRSSKKRAD